MKYRELVLFLSCHGMEDFPLYHSGDEATGLLACWSAMWHPSLLAAAESLPRLCRPDDPPEELAERLLVIPTVSDSEIPVGFAQRAEKEGARVLRKMHNRREILEAALAPLDDALQLPGDSSELVADFLALGYCHLQVSALTQQLRYTESLDEQHFQDEVVTAAKAALGGDFSKTKEHLVHCFDMLGEARDQVYPVDSYIIDITLVAESTLGAALREQAALPTATNLLISGQLLDSLDQREPESLAAIRAAIDGGTADIVGGDWVEGPVPLEPREAVLKNLRQGIAAYEKRLGHRPTVYGRRRFGLSPMLPQILRSLGFVGALHTTFEEGRAPWLNQSKLRWQGPDGTDLDALARTPLDANRADNLLRYGEKLNESIETDHVATVCFTHWPGQVCDWYEDLRRTATYGPVLGKFVTLRQYFEQTSESSDVGAFVPDQYRSPYLAQAVRLGEENPISRHVERLQQQADADAAQTLTTLAALLRDNTGEAEVNVDTATAAKELAAALPRGEAAAGQGYLVTNPYSFSRRIGNETPELTNLPAADGPLHAVQQSAEVRRAVVDVPAMGFAWIPTADAPPRPLSGKAATPLAEENLLRNEFMEVKIDPTTGSIRSVHDYQSRGNRISQQLAFRTPGPRPAADEAALYSVMAADSIEVTSTGPALGEIVARGRLLSRSGDPLAQFTQTVRLWKGSRVLRLEIELDCHAQPSGSPWNSYYAARFAWGDASADMVRSVGLGSHPTDAKHLEAPHFLDLRSGKSRTTILTGGLPYHKRTGMRNVDSLLVVHGEKRWRYRMGIGIDLKYPATAALELLAGDTAVAEIAAPPSSGPASWLFHLSARNVIATHWEPIREAGQIRGVRVRLLETEGRAATCRLSAFREIASARRVDFSGNGANELTIEAGAALVPLDRYGWVEIEARWKR